MKPFENIVGKGENAGNQDKFHYQSSFKLPSANAVKLDKSIFLMWKRIKVLYPLPFPPPPKKKKRKKRKKHCRVAKFKVPIAAN